MTISLNSKTYKADSFSPDRVVYIGPAKTVSTKDLVTVSRTAPKPTASFRGVARQSIKLTRTVTLDDSTTADVIIDIGTSVPVGIVTADLLGVVADAVDILQLEEAGTTAIIADSVINY